MGGRKKVPGRVYHPNWGGKRANQGRKKEITEIKKHHFFIFLDDEDKEKFRAWADRRGLAMARLGRLAIREFMALDKYPSPPNYTVSTGRYIAVWFTKAEQEKVQSFCHSIGLSYTAMGITALNEFVKARGGWDE